MFFAKNLPTWERILRVLMGLVCLAFAVLSWGTSRVGVMAGIAGFMLAMTGLVGFCPMCAMAGRKLNKES